MGEQMDGTQLEYGNDCGCFSAGKTPKYVYVKFLDLIDCQNPPPFPSFPPPNGITIRLIQDPIAACLYEISRGEFNIRFYMQNPPPAEGTLFMNDSNGWILFQCGPEACPNDGIVLDNIIGEW
ncbi:unnamed protein product, partial [marine sediment metagenome]